MQGLGLGFLFAGWGVIRQWKAPLTDEEKAARKDKAQKRKKDKKKGVKSESESEETLAC